MCQQVKAQVPFNCILIEIRLAMKWLHCGPLWFYCVQTIRTKVPLLSKRRHCCIDQKCIWWKILLEFALELFVLQPNFSLQRWLFVQSVFYLLIAYHSNQQLPIILMMRKWNCNNFRKSHLISYCIFNIFCEGIALTQASSCIFY